ncbi:glycosyltransferase family 4 protein [Micromonospora sp. NPDC000089]|uniref:glycosyltransferase family 4 protein n=1 Tax=unclassified Micromonospora TaxID=2617518 RepID=UPI0036CCDC05
MAFVTQWFAPEPAITPIWIARSLDRQGLRLDILTGIPNYPTGEVVDGFSAWRRYTEAHDRMRVHRTPLYPSHDQSPLRRIINYASYAMSASVFGSKVLRSADVALVYSTPATAALPGMVGRARWGMPYVLMVMDVWPDSVFATGFLAGGSARRIAEPALTWLTNHTYRWADHITATSPRMREALISRGVPADKVSVVYNWTDEKTMRPSEPDPSLRARLGVPADAFLLMYGGNHGAAQGLDAAVHAMRLLRDRPEIHLALVGVGIEKPVLRDLAARLELPNVHFVDPVDAARMPAVMAAADLQLVSLVDQPLFHFTLPSKVQAIMACGQPVLACAPGDAADVVRDARCGLSAPPGDAQALAHTIRQAADLPRQRLREMGLAGRDYYLAHLGEEINAQRLADLIRDAASRRRRGRATHPGGVR